MQEKLVNNFKSKIFPIKNADEISTPKPAPEPAAEPARDSTVFGTLKTTKSQT